MTASDKFVVKSKEHQIKNGLYYLLPLITRSLLPLIGLSIFTRILTKEDYGVLALAQAYAIFVAGLANLGMTTAYNRNFYQYRYDSLKTAQLLYSVLAFVSLNFLIASGITFFLKGMLSKLITDSDAYGNVFLWSVIAQYFLGMGHHYFLVYFRNLENAKDFAKYSIAGTVFTFLLSLLFVTYIKTGVVGLVYSQLFSGAIICLVLICRFISVLPISFDKKIFIEALKIAYPTTPKIFVGVIGTHFDKYMIGLIASIGGAGIYSIGQKISNLVFTFMSAVGNVFSPQVYQRMFKLEDTGGEHIGKYLTPFAYICIFFAMLIALFSYEVIIILTPPTYHEATDIVAILAIYYGILFFGKITGPQLIYKKKMFLGSILAMTRIGINVGLNIPFILKWGALGAAWATLLSGMLSGFIGFTLAQHFYPVQWEYKKLWCIYGIFFGFSLLVIILKYLYVPYSVLFSLKIIAVTIYSFLGMRISLITLENYRMIKNMASGWMMRIRSTT